jgi:hypothetical protein
VLQPLPPPLLVLLPPLLEELLEELLDEPAADVLELPEEPLVVDAEPPTQRPPVQAPEQQSVWVTQG